MRAHLVHHLLEVIQEPIEHITELKLVCLVKPGLGALRLFQRLNVELIAIEAELLEGLESFLIFFLCREEVFVLHEADGQEGARRDALGMFLGVRLWEQRHVLFEKFLVLLAQLGIVVRVDKVPEQVLPKVGTLDVQLVCLVLPRLEEKQVLVFEELSRASKRLTGLRDRAAVRLQSVQLVLQHVDAFNVVFKVFVFDLAKNIIFDLKPSFIALAQ